MSQSSIKKKGYLAKLPVKGLVKVGAKRDCFVASLSHIRYGTHLFVA